MGGWVEILFPIAEVNDPQTKAWYVDGGTNQSWSDIFGSGGSFAPGAVPHQIGTDTVQQFTPPPPPAPPAPPQCLANLDWKSDYIDANNLSTVFPGQPQTNQLDRYGNYYLPTAEATLVFDPNGNVIASLSNLWLADGVDAWFGSAIVRRSSSFNISPIGFYATPILQGQYIVAFFQAFTTLLFAYWYVILQPNQSGPPTVIGAVYYEGLLGPPYAYYLQFLGIANQQTINDPIMIRGAFGIGATAWTIALLPSISTIITGTYKTNGFPGENLPCKVPAVRYYPVANNNFSNNLSLFSPDYDVKGGFVLPNSSGGTNLYFYIDRRMMDYNATHNDATTWTEVRNVLQPAYANGCIVKINMGVIDYQSAASTAFTHAGSAGATNMYTVDNAAWNDGASAQIPFTDEYTYLSSGATGGTDDYIMQPGAVVDRGNGIWWIIFYMPGEIDAIANNLDRIYESVRVFQYNTSTEVATQILKQTCVLYTNSDIPVGSLLFRSVDMREGRQAWSISDAGGLITLHVNGYRFDQLTATKFVYKTDFLQFTP